MKSARFLSLLLICSLLLPVLAACGVEHAEAAPQPAFPSQEDPEETQAVTPEVPSDLNASAAVSADGSVTLNWDADGAAFYEILAISPYDASRTELAQICADGSETYTYTDETAGTNYYRVYAVESFLSREDLDAGVPQNDARFPIHSGFVTEFGVLRYYVNNKAVINREVNGLTFGPDGVYTSGNEDLDAYVTQLLHDTVPDDLPQVEKLRILYNWVIDRSEYAAVRFITQYDETGWEPEAALKLFQNGYGNCFSYAAGVCMLARAIGLEAHCVVGSCFQATQWVDHAWTEVTLDGVTYFCDPEMEGVFSRKRDYGWDLFMKQYGDEGPTDYNIEKVF